MESPLLGGNFLLLFLAFLVYVATAVGASGSVRIIWVAGMIVFGGAALCNAAGVTRVGDWADRIGGWSSRPPRAGSL